MGVTGLWKLIEPCGTPVPVETLEGKILAVDISIWLHQVVKGFQDSNGSGLAHAHLLGLFHRLCKLLYYRVKPVFVFDGCVPQLKRDTIARRQQQRNKLNNEANRIQNLLLEQLAKEHVVQKALGTAIKELLPTKRQNSKNANVQGDEDDLFKLPELPSTSQANSSLDDSTLQETSFDSDEQSTSEDGSSAKRYYQNNLQAIDVRSEHFRSLPADMRYEILVDIKDTRKQSSWGRLHEMPAKSDDFSTFQMRRLLKRRAVQESLEEAEKEMGGRTLTYSELQTYFKEEGVLPVDAMAEATKQIASDENTRFLLVKNLKKQDEPKENNVKAEIVSIDEKKKPKIEKTENLGRDYEADLQLAIALSLSEQPDAVYKEDDYVLKEGERIKLNRQQKNAFRDAMHGPAKTYMIEYAGMNEDEVVDIMEKSQIPETTEKRPSQICRNEDEFFEFIGKSHITDTQTLNFVNKPESNTLENNVAAKPSADVLNVVIDPNEEIKDDIFADVFTGMDTTQQKGRELIPRPDKSKVMELLENLKKLPKNPVTPPTPTKADKKAIENFKIPEMLPINKIDLCSPTEEIKNDVFTEIDTTQQTDKKLILKPDREKLKEFLENFKNLKKNNVTIPTSSSHTDNDLIPTKGIDLCSSDTDDVEIAQKLERYTISVPTKEVELSSSDTDDDDLVAVSDEKEIEYLKSLEKLHTNTLTNTNISSSDSDSDFIDIAEQEQNDNSPILNGVVKPKDDSAETTKIISTETEKSKDNTLSIQDELRQLMENAKNINLSSIKPKNDIIEINDDESESKPVVIKSEIIEIPDDARPKTPTSAGKKLNPHTPTRITDFYNKDYVIKRTPDKIEEEELNKVKSPFYRRKTPKSSSKSPKQTTPVKTKTAKNLFAETEPTTTDVLEEAANALKQQKSDVELRSLATGLAAERRELESERNRQDRMGMNITQRMNVECQQLLRLFGIPYIIAPTEAEAQCAFLEAVQLTNGTITDDSDIWLFGGRTVYKNFFAQNKHVLKFSAEEIENKFKCDRQTLVQLACLVGSDYTTGVHGIGAVTALEILSSFAVGRSAEKSTENMRYHITLILDTLQRFRDWWQASKVVAVTPSSTARHNLMKKLRNIEIAEGFPSLAVIEAYLMPKVDESRTAFSWGLPDVESIHEFTRKTFGWTNTKTDTIMRPVLKRLAEKHTQTTMRNYFLTRSAISGRELKVSKRVQGAIERLAKGGAEEEAAEMEPTVKQKKTARKTKKEGLAKVGTDGVSAKEDESATAVKQKKTVRKPAKKRVIKSNEQADEVKTCEQKREIIPQREKNLAKLNENKEKAVLLFKESPLNKKKK